MKRVAILLSTYNGEKYVEAQLDSILGQTYQNIRVYVRDDGSKDNTLLILKRYEEEGKIRLFPGENIGFVKSFLWLLQNCEKSDLYAFSDQDDVWKSDKVERAVSFLQNEKSIESIPFVYCSGFDICDEDLHVKEKKEDLFLPFTIQKTITSGLTGFGLTQMFNNPVRDMIIDRPFPKLSRVFGHDTLVHLIGLCWGKVIFDRESTVWYRRHGNNASTQEYHGGSIFKHQLWRIREFLFHSNGKVVYEDAKEFYNLYKYELDEKQRKIFELYLVPEYKVSNVWRKITYKGRYRKSMVDEIALRILFLIHKM